MLDRRTIRHSACPALLTHGQKTVRRVNRSPACRGLRSKLVVDEPLPANHSRRGTGARVRQGNRGSIDVDTVRRRHRGAGRRWMVVEMATLVIHEPRPATRGAVELFGLDQLHERLSVLRRLER